MDITYVPDPAKADGQLGTGSNLTEIPAIYSDVLITYVPNPVTATGPAVVLGEGAVEGDMWFKVTAGTSNNQWFKVLST